MLFRSIFNAAAGTGSIGNFVWNDLNGDGIQNDSPSGSGVLGVTGVSVNLLDANTGAILATTTTDANGYYLFPNLNGGDYKVTFGNLPAGFTFTTQETTPGATGSDASPSGSGVGTTGTISLTAGQNRTDIDAGIRSTTTAGLGDYVWFDTNNNGVQDAGEKPIAGVLVKLYDNVGTAVASAITDANGYYAFLNLTPGTYTLGFENIPNGSMFTQKDATASGGNDTNDSDVTPKG